MKISSTFKQALFLGCLLSFTTACDNSQSKKTEEPTPITKNDNNNSPELKIHERGEPDGMNPLVTNHANSEYIQNNLFQKLLRYNLTDLKLIPQLAVSLPEVTVLEQGEFAGGMSLTYEIHPEATWDNGTPITADDYVFTIKAIKNPSVNAASLRPYVQFIEKIEIDPTNPKKFTIFSKERYFLAEEASGNVTFIIPEYHYDPEGIMRQFAIEQLNDENVTKDNASISRFAEQFNAPAFNREAAQVIGSGAYQLKEWTTGERIVLEHKKDWWGDKVKGNKMLEAHPPKITYRVFKDWTAAITNAKDGQVDVMRSIPPTEFVRLRDDSKFSGKFDLSTPDQFVYSYIAFNTKRPQLSDKRVRRAIAHLVNKEDYITSIMEDMAKPTATPIHPTKDYYNKELKNIAYDIEKAKSLLADAGWKDTDGDNILDKKVGGKKVDFKLDYRYDQGNVVRKSMGLLLQNEAKRVGIQIDLMPMDFTNMLEKADNGDFDLITAAWVNTPGLDDLKQIWHSDAALQGGGNRAGYSSPKLDKIIDQIRVTLDKDERRKLYQEAQAIIYEDQPYIFLFAPSERIAIHNRFEGTETSPARPGYNEARFKLRNK